MYQSLNNCPYCGDQADKDGTKATGYWVQCCNGDARTKNYDSLDGAINAWNSNEIIRKLDNSN